MQLKGLLTNLNLTPDTNELDKIQKIAVEACKNKATVEETVNNIYQRCVRDWEFAKVGAQIARKLCDIEADGCKFRACLLSHIQNDYRSKYHECTVIISTSSSDYTLLAWNVCLCVLLSVCLSLWLIVRHYQ